MRSKCFSRRALLLFVPLIVLFCLWAEFPHRVTCDEIRKIEVGMTKGAVVSIVGRPYFKHMSNDEECWYYLTWGNGGDPYFLWFDKSGRLKDVR